MELRERIELECKDTLGHSESENKDSFMTGVGVAISKLEIHYEQEINNLKRQVERYRVSCEDMTNELKTISSIIKRYSYDD